MRGRGGGEEGEHRFLHLSACRQTETLSIEASDNLEESERKKNGVEVWSKFVLHHGNKNVQVLLSGYQASVQEEIFDNL